MRARRPEDDPRIKAAVLELEELIRQRWPEAEFSVSFGSDDPESVNLYAIVDTPETDEVCDLVVDRVFALQDTGLPVHVIPLRTPEREAQVLASEGLLSPQLPPAV